MYLESAMHFLITAIAICVLAVVSSALKPPSIDLPPGTVITVGKLQVPFGRSVFVNPISDLKIKVNEGDYCSVTVLPDVTSLTPGFLLPEHFPCNFRAQEVTYSHFGSRSPSTHTVRLQVRYDTPNETYIAPLALPVDILFVQRTVVTKALFITVPQLLGISDVIDDSVLEFSYDADDSCQVSTNTAPSELPRYGRLIEDPSQGFPVSCDHFLNSGVKYQHEAITNSPNRDEIPMVVEIFDVDGNQIKQEYFQVTVKILGGLENTAPMPDFSAMMMMEVDQFVMTAITPELLRAHDVESDPGNLVFNITKPLRAQQGEFVSTDNRNQGITSFLQADVSDLRIAYKPPAVDSDDLRFLEVEMVVIDTEGAVSEPFNFVVLVKPMNTMAPVVTRNTGQLLYQGQSRPLSSRKNLEISDEDNLDDVRIEVASGLRHGVLDTNGQKSFTPADLDAGAVVYKHDGTNTYSDNIVFKMTDGKNVVEFLFTITIAVVDNTAPVLDANTGLTVNKGSTEVITSWILSAADIDSDDLNINFVLEEPYSDEGQFLLLSDSPEYDLDAWSERPDGKWEQQILQFTQAQLLSQEVNYRHIGPHSTGVVMDRIRFHVEDDNRPPNKSPVKEFVVKVLPVDDIPPRAHDSAANQVDVNEYELTPLGRALLRYTDEDTNDRELRYTLTSPIAELSPIVPLESAGRLVLTDHPEQEVTSFTQAQINHKKISYQPPQTELGIIARALQFTYSVADNAGNEITDQVFTIFLRPVNNKPPKIVNTGFTVLERGTKAITPDILDATDDDTDDELLMFTITELPVHGTLSYDTSPFAIGDDFTRSDLVGFHILYQHSGNEVTSDEFSLEISDGMHSIPITVRIRVEPIDDEVPLLAMGGDLDLKIDVQELGLAVISPQLLSATDSDTDDLMLTFLVTSLPEKGHITVSGEPVNSFTQENIQNGIVAYTHTSGEIGPETKSDSFGLTVSDLSNDWIIGGNKVETIQMKVNIIPVDNQQPMVVMSDDFYVDEGTRAQIESRHLDATDEDTNNDDILCMVDTQANFGFLENISPAPGSEKSRKGTPISSFTIADIKAGNINYMQNVIQDREPIEDTFSFSCQDGTPNASPVYFFNIAINPVNDEEPILYYTEFVVDEGGALTIDLPRLDAEDRDIPADPLTFTITQTPKNGQFFRIGLEEPIPVSTFSWADIESSNIVYQHDGTETISDQFEVMLSDGEHEVKQIIPITVIPVDDETPRMTINNGIDVEIAEEKIITNSALKATDVDSDDRSLRYIIKFAPRNGNLTRTSPSGESRHLSIGENFTQSEIDEKRISYVHTGQEGVRDLIKFDVTDGLNPLIDRYFYVNIAGIDTFFPGIVNKGVTLKEGGRVTLTTDILSTEDLNSADEDLQFTIAHAPSRGHLENTDMPGVPITTFTQLEIAGNKIQYVHTSLEEIKMDSFEFEVTDGYNPVYRTFRISISDVDNKTPVVTTTNLRLEEGATKLITPFELKVEDSDTPDKKLKISITQVPVHGKILINGSPSRFFTMENLNENMVAYAHDGSETVGDSFSFVVTDGTHTDFYVFPETAFPTNKPQRMDIRIVPVDNKVPQILINRGAPSLSELASGHRGYRLTKKVLRADDLDSDVKSLRFRVTETPKNGFLFNMDDSKTPITNFTQDDIDQMNIFYILNQGSNATGDSFKFKLVDDGDNELDEQTFLLNWACISLSSANYSVTEEEKFLEVTLNRRGYLGETSFVSISTRNGTAKSNEDFRASSAKQVQFNPGQSQGHWKIKILQDESYEESEIFYVDLAEPVMGILEEPRNASIALTDAEDESTVSFSADHFVVDEHVGELLLTIHREGDVSNEMMVICHTEQASATGTTPTKVLSYSDYISRPNDHNSLITFDRGESEKTCRIVIIDDSLYEPDESFNVMLSSPMGGRLGEFTESEIVIAADINDEPMFYFENEIYSVDESDGYVEVRVWRTGTDISQVASITVQSRKSTPESAKANEDYVGISETIEFPAESTMQTVRVVILDDLGNPVLEGIETFDLVLRMPMAAILGEPNHIVVSINDTYSDLPLMQFDKSAYEVNEAEETVSAKIVRSGDLSHSSSVRCYTRQASAEVMMDYAERPNTNASIVYFEPGESEARCVVVIENDGVHEDPEEFRLLLGSPVSETAGEARIGKREATEITILDDADRPVIEFGQSTYEVTEPDGDDFAIVSVEVVRKGDLTQTSSVRFFTKNGNAQSGKDYNPVSRELVFGVNVSQVVVNLEILHDEEKEIRESFTVRLEPDKNMIADLGVNRAIIYINQERILADVTFPYPPTVISLLDYDTSATAAKQPSPGYPLVCVTPCNPKHYDYEKVNAICSSEGIDDKQTEFRWLVAAPTSSDNVTNKLREVAQSTFFTDTNYITLDSIYFKAGSRVACAARAVTVDGDAGIESTSKPVTVSTTSGVCPSRVAGSVGAEPFSASIRYTAGSDPKYANLIKVSISMPHFDGMLPAISTRQLSNFEITLSRDASRVGNHRCSNIVNYNELVTQHGFLSEVSRNSDSSGETYPYQYSANLRGNKTLRFYRNLNLEACLWEFTSYYDMSELLTECGGKSAHDGQVLNLLQSFVSLRLPLYVSYIYHSPVGKGWQHYDQQTELRLTFTYDTAILWENGIGSPPEAELQGFLYPTSMRIQDDGRMMVSFRTEARFRGQFVLEHSSIEQQSMVMSADHPELQMSLNLIRSEATYNQPEQKWSFTTDYAIRDYSGTYNIKLFPCTTSAEQSYSLPIVCNPREALNFKMDIRLQQVSDPVAAEFSLNTNFFLLSKESLWLSDGSMGFGEDSDVAFVEGARIFGRVVVDPVQNLGSSFDASIEKVFICTGRDGYIPKYDPTQSEYGCLADAPSLLHRFKVLDKEQPSTQDSQLNNVDFEAKLAIDDPGAIELVKRPGTDGFRMASQPLFTVTGREWYMHAIYSVTSKDRNRRSISHMYNSMIRASDILRHRRSRRAVEPPIDAKTLGADFDRGTNMQHLRLNHTTKSSAAARGGTVGPTSDEPSSDTQSATIFVVIGIVCVLLLTLIVVFFVVRWRRRQASDGKGKYSAATHIVKPGKGRGKVPSAEASILHSGSDASEV